MGARLCALATTMGLATPGQLFLVRDFPGQPVTRKSNAGSILFVFPLYSEDIAVVRSITRIARRPIRQLPPAQDVGAPAPQVQLLSPLPPHSFARMLCCVPTAAAGPGR